MERMTKKEQLAGYTVNYIGEDDCFDVWSVPKKFMGNAVDRLAAYEDTGLEPDDIKRVFNEDAVLNLAGQALGITPDRLRELAQADREGRCVVIDVKIGQRVWILDVGEYGDDEIAQPLGLEV